ncbi:phage baseplate assembly protein V [Bradyrhizobium sp. USDA 3315]
MNMIEPFPQETTLEAGGSAKGVAVAIVRQNKDDSGQARVRVSYPWHSRPRDSYWARVALPMGGRDRGTYFLPEVDDEVLVAFERGDVRFPYVVGSLWNGVDKSPTNNADGKNDIRMVKSRKGHKLTFDDGSKGLVRLELNDGKKLELDDDGIKLDDGKGNKLVIKTSSGSISIESAASLSLKAPKIEIAATGEMKLTAGALLTVQGSIVKIN